MFSVRDKIVERRPISTRRTLKSSREHLLDCCIWLGRRCTMSCSPGSAHHIAIIVDSYIYYGSFLANDSKDPEEGCLSEFTQGYLLSSLQPGWQPGVLTTMVECGECIGGCMAFLPWGHIVEALSSDLQDPGGFLREENQCLKDAEDWAKQLRVGMLQRAERMTQQRSGDWKRQSSGSLNFSDPV